MKYYTAFLYKDVGPSELHCTHKYFGKLAELTIDEVVETIDAYFAAQTKPFRCAKEPVPFTIEDFFGGKYKTRVLKMPKPYMQLLPTLRTMLDSFAKDQYSEYRPHVTCDKEYGTIEQPFDRYALVGSGGVIVKEWKL